MTYKTPFSKRVEILGQVWLYYNDSDERKSDETWNKYFEVYDIGLPLAYFIWTGVASIKKGNENYIDDAWNDLCDMISVDNNIKYNSLTELFSASPNSPIEN